MKMKSLLSLLLAALCLLALLSGCGTKIDEIDDVADAVEAAGQSDDDRLTMFVGLGNTNSTYYEELHEAILEYTGIDVQYVYFNTVDTTNAMNICVKNNDLPADIICTAMRLDEEDQKNAFLDLAAYTNLPELFTSARQQSMSVDGAVYQLPFSTRLIGIEYNKTLLEEMGWELPNNFDDMVALKEEVEAAGYTFAVSGGVATGHGFNYLLNVMASQYMSSPDGYEWLYDFRGGEDTIDAFAEEAVYFKNYADAGLFGNMHTEDWNANREYCQTRALFYYNTINDVYSYDGYRYNDDGTICGAEYGEDGLPVAVADDEGEAVLLDGEYVFYDENNEDHAGLERYTIPGAEILHDTYGSMPWISENGSSNCFVTLDNMLVALNKELGEEDQSEKLDQAIRVLEFMASETAADIFSELYRDGYVSTKTYNIDETRLYYDYAKQVQGGWTVNWFYNDFDIDSIVNVGQKVNDYLCGANDVSFDDIIAELEFRNENYLNQESDVLTTVTEELDFEDNARLQAIANAMSVQEKLDEAGEDIEVTISLMPYIEDFTDISESKSMGLVQAKIYEGDLETSLLNAYIANRSNKPVAIEMTGAEINEILRNGFNTLADYEYDHCFDYVCATKNYAEIDDGASYWVAVAPESLESEVYNGFLDAGKVVMTENEDGEEVTLTGSTADGILLCLEEYDELSPAVLTW